MTLDTRDDTNQASQKLVDQLIQLVAKLAHELRSDSSISQQVLLESKLDSELGFDSLSRVELLHRVEQKFLVHLPSNALAQVETVADILQLIISRRGDKQVFDKQILESLSTGQVHNNPDNAHTLLDVLNWHLTNHPDRTHIELYRDAGHGLQINFAQLAANSYRVAWGLNELHLPRGARVTLMLPTSAEYFYSFLGVIAAGGISVPIYPPARLSQIESYIRRHQTILNNCQAEVMITTPEIKKYAPLLKSLAPSIRSIVSIEDFTHCDHTQLKLNLSSEDIAFIQYTSGSTAAPKGVQLTHGNLLANIRAMGKVTQLTSDDTFVSWLPLYHDMGLIGAWLGMFYHSAKLVVMSPLDFLVHPRRWLWAIHRHQATLSAAPNFAYDLCVHRIDESDLKGLDLQHWRIAFNGAEPVVPETIRKFCERFQHYGFNSASYWPVYGLAEASVGLTFPRTSQAPLIQKIDRDTFSNLGKAVPVENDEHGVLEFVGCGEVLPGHQIRIVDDMDVELPESQQGHLQFKGPSTTRGYFKNSQQTKKLFHDDWLDSGDLAYIYQGQIFLTGRIKDIIIRAGRNIYPHEIEDAVGAVEGVRRGRVVAFGVTSESSGKEKLIVLAETRERNEESKKQIRTNVLKVCAEIVDLPPDEVILAPPNTILKTSSGKLRRDACRQLYLKNQIGVKHSPLWVQLTKIALSSIRIRLKKLIQESISIFYALYVWLLFGFTSFVFCIVMVFIPKREIAFKFSRKMAKLLVTASSTHLTINGREYLESDQPVVFVANHCSYVDIYFLVVALGYNFSFVAKSELQKNPLARFILKRLGVVYVERFDAEKSVEDADSLMHRDESLFFFPEGTFTRKPGLANFHMGAFLVAAKTNRSVIPVTLKGTRSILRAGSWFPRKGEVTVTVGEPIQPSPDEDVWQAANQLRSAARNQILSQCDEPDLETD